MYDEDMPDLDIDTDAIEAEVKREQTAAATLENVRIGGAVLVGLAQTRLSEALAAVKEGRFSDAMRFIQEAEAKVSGLQAAEYNLGAFAGTTRIARATEVPEGAMLLGVGRIVKREVFTVQHATGSDCEHVKFEMEDGSEPEYHGQRELLIARDDA